MTMTPQELRRDRELIPRVLLRAVGILMAASLAIVIFARVTDQPLAAQWPDLAVVEAHELRIFAEMSGSARVFTADGELVADLNPEEGGFIAGVTRALTRERTKHGVATDAPVRLVRFEDGRLGLRDDLSGWRVELLGFGTDNTAAWARLMAAATELDEATE